MTKAKASLIHLILSLIAISSLFALVYLIWYPYPFFDVSGTIEPFKLLIIIDVIIGPVLTFIVYKKGKKTLIMDLTVIAILQVSALVYGTYTIYGGRPTLVVMNQGQFSYLIDKFANYEDLDESLQPHWFSQPKYAFNVNVGVSDLYQDSVNFLPVSDFDTELKPYSFSAENIKAMFTKKEDQVNQLEEKYKDDEVFYFVLDNDMVKHYVVYSRNKNRIIDRIRF